MITRFARLASQLAVALTLLLTMTACGGGGGGSGGGGFIPDDGSDLATYILDLLLNDSSGNITTTVTSTQPGTLIVHVRDGGTAIADVVVTAASSIGLILPESGTALTNAEGNASFQVTAGDSIGAGTITVTVEAPSGTVTETMNLQVGPAGLRLGYYNSNGFVDGIIGVQPESTLSAMGTAELTIAVADESGVRATTAESVTINSPCLANGQATLDPPSPMEITGQLNTTYTATGCEGDDTITATLDGGEGRATTTLGIASPSATSVAFESAEPPQLALRGTGGGTTRQESSNVKFILLEVINSNTVPVAGVEVNFALSTVVGGLALANTSAISDENGEVIAVVNSGDVATAVRVTASITAESGETLSTLSDVLIISTGLPDQNSISLSAEKFDVERGFSRDGVEITITVRMADKFNNPVPDGTSALFTTEYGSIGDSCTTTTGACTVVWSSQNPRYPFGGLSSVKSIFDTGYSCPSHRGSSGPCPDDMGGPWGGRSTVSVSAVGEESFIDRNGNGVFDQDEADAIPSLFVNLPEAFNDYDENGIYTPISGGPCDSNPVGSGCDSSGFEETFVDFNANGVYDLNVDPNTGEGVYNGILCPVEGDGVWCSRELVNVRDDLVLTLLADTEYYILLTRESTGSIVTGTTEGPTYIAYISDYFNAAPAAGSTITVEAGGGCEVVSETSITAPLSYYSGALAIVIQTDGDGEDGTVTVKIDPSGDAGPTSITFGCASLPPPVVDPNAPSDGGGLSTGG